MYEYCFSNLGAIYAKSLFRAVASNRPTEALASVISFAFVVYVITNTLNTQEENSTMDRLSQSKVFFSGYGTGIYYY